MRAALVPALVATQSLEVGDGVRLLTDGPLWALPALAVAALATTLGFAAAQARAGDNGTKDIGAEDTGAGETGRAFIADRLRVTAPVLVIAVLAAAFALGPWRTNRSVRNYLVDVDTWGYLTNLIGWPRYALPGVFEFNDLPDIVNANVWVVPCYLAAIAFAGLRRPARRRWIVPAIVAGALALAVLLAQAFDMVPDPRDVGGSLLRGHGLTALLGWLIGMVAFDQRHRLPRRPWPALAAGTLLALVVLGGNPGWLQMPAFRVGLALPAGYLALWFLTRPLPMAELAAWIEPYLLPAFLFSFPLQQLAVELGPRRQDALVNLGLAMPVTAAVSVAYWWLIGRRLLSARQRAIPPVAIGRKGRPWRLPRLDRDTAAVHLAVGLILVIIGTMMMFMLYIAIQPDQAAM